MFRKRKQPISRGRRSHAMSKYGVWETEEDTTKKQHCNNHRQQQQQMLTTYVSVGGETQLETTTIEDKLWLVSTTGGDTCRPTKRSMIMVPSSQTPPMSLSQLPIELIQVIYSFFVNTEKSWYHRDDDHDYNDDNDLYCGDNSDLIDDMNKERLYRENSYSSSYELSSIEEESYDYQGMIQLQNELFCQLGLVCQSFHEALYSSILWKSSVLHISPYQISIMAERTNIHEVCKFNHLRIVQSVSSKCKIDLSYQILQFCYPSTNITTLSFKSVSISHPWLVSLLNYCRSLRTLELCDVIVMSNDLREVQFSEFGLENLESLCLIRVQSTRRHIQTCFVSQLIERSKLKLRRLKFYESNELMLSGDDLQSLLSSTALETLQLMNCRSITDQHFWTGTERGYTATLRSVSIVQCPSTTPICILQFAKYLHIESLCYENSDFIFDEFIQTLHEQSDDQMFDRYNQYERLNKLQMDINGLIFFLQYVQVAPLKEITISDEYFSSDILLDSLFQHSICSEVNSLQVPVVCTNQIVRSLVANALHFRIEKLVLEVHSQETSLVYESGCMSSCKLLRIDDIQFCNYRQFSGLLDVFSGLEYLHLDSISECSKMKVPYYLEPNYRSCPMLKQLRIENSGPDGLTVLAIALSYCRGLKEVYLDSLDDLNLRSYDQFYVSECVRRLEFHNLHMDLRMWLMILLLFPDVERVVMDNCAIVSSDSVGVSDLLPLVEPCIRDHLLWRKDYTGTKVDLWSFVTKVILPSIGSNQIAHEARGYSLSLNILLNLPVTRSSSNKTR